MPAQERLCDACQQVKPASKFLPSSLSPTGYLTNCMDCIRKTAEEHRIERARIAETAERKEHSEVGGHCPGVGICCRLGRRAAGGPTAVEEIGRQILV
jgi:hypothetical protein